MKFKFMVLLLSFCFTANCVFALTYKAVKTEGGEEHTMIKLYNNMILACGYSSDGQLGTSRTKDNILDFVLDGEQNTTSGYIENIIGFDAGWQHSIAVDSSGSCWTWGDDGLGELGDIHTSSNAYTPVQVHSGEQDPTSSNTFLQNIIAVAAGRSGEHSLAIESNTGHVLSFGNDCSGQLGNDTQYYNKHEPVYVLRGEQADPNDGGVYTYLERIVAVSAGQFNSMALDNAGYVYTFGGSGFTNGILGAGDSVVGHPTPIIVHDGQQNNTSGLLENIIAIDSGWSHCIALEKNDPNYNNMNGRVYCWGNGDGGYSGRIGGRLGDGFTIDRNEPVYVHAGAQNPSDPDSPLEGIIAISAGESHSLALSKDGFVYAWGAGGDYCLGQGDQTDHPRPVRVKGGDQGGKYLENIVSIGAGYWHNIAIDNDGNVYTWGAGVNGKLGTGNSYAQPLPTRIVLPDGNGHFTTSIVASIENLATLASPVDPNANDITFTISVTNPIDPNDNSPVFGDLTNVDIKLYLPAGLTYEYVDINNLTIDPNYDPERRIYNWHIDSFPANTTVTKTLNVNINKYAEPGTDLKGKVRVDIGIGYDEEIYTIPVADWYEIDNGVIYVDAGASERLGKGTSWNYPYVKLTDALARAARSNADNNTIWVAAGNYVPVGGNSFEIPRFVNVYGGFAGYPDETLLSHRDYIANQSILYGYDSNYVVQVVDANSLTGTPTIDGLVVTGGKLAGIYLNNHDANIAHCIITENGIPTQSSNGYGIQTSGSNVNIDDCIVSYNIKNGLRIEGSGNANIYNSWIAKNGDDGIYCSGSATVDVINTVVNHNVNNGIWINNQLASTIRNCSIVSNTARAVNSESSNTTVTNSILWSNADVENTTKTVADRRQYLNCVVTYSCINDPNDVAGTTTGYDATTYNTIANPDFIYQDPNSVILFAIDSTSPCKDHGSNTGIATGEKDFYGNDRIYNLTVDMGAFEVNGLSSTSGQDYNLDALVNLVDFVPLKSSWLAANGDANYNPACDYNSNGSVGTDDLFTFADNWLWEPYFLYNNYIVCRVNSFMNLEPFEVIETIAAQAAPMSMMAMSLDSASFAVSSEEMTYDDRSLSVASLAISDEPQVLVTLPPETPRKPAPEPTEYEKTLQMIETLSWLDDMYYDGELNNTMTLEEWLDFRDSLVESIEQDDDD